MFSFACNFLKSIEKSSWFLFIIGLFTRLSFVFYLFSLGGSSFLGGADHSQYEALAKNIVMQHVFSLSTIAPFVPDSLRTPGYPLFLAISFAITGGFVFAAIAQAFLGAFIPVLIYKIGRIIGISSFASTIAAIISIIDLNFVSNTASLQTESLFVPILLFAIWFSFKSSETYSYKSACVQGILFGILALIRPAFLYVGIGFLLLLTISKLWHSKRMAVYGIMSIFVMIATISPWLIRNHQQFGSFDLASIGPVNMYSRLAVSVLAVRDGIPFWTEYKNTLHNLALDGKIPDLDYPENESALYDIRYNKILNSETLSVIRENPKAFFKLQANSIFAILTHDNTLNILQTMHIIHSNYYPRFSVSFLFLTASLKDFFVSVLSVLHGWYLIPFLGRGFWTLITLGSFVGTYQLLRKSRNNKYQRENIIFIIYCVVAFIIVTLPVALSIDARMRVPIEPFLLLLACHAFSTILKKQHVSEIS